MKFLPASLWSFLRWNLGDPKKLFFIVLNRFFQWAIEGEPGVVAADSEESAGTKVNWMKVQFPQHVSFSCPHFHSQRLRMDHQSKARGGRWWVNFKWNESNGSKECVRFSPLHFWHCQNILYWFKHYETHGWYPRCKTLLRKISDVFSD